ncbi:unnamed protein product [Pleuronectes platessa]|uniref:Uncharacterized protein n=1 Tax=Pleuronectes platessa TaxID=8262 RepID=A0A9N7Y5H1_PLEPL|nr:unnamed protein product [Pleuronectes platessa]
MRQKLNSLGSAPNSTSGEHGAFLATWLIPSLQCSMVLAAAETGRLVRIEEHSDFRAPPCSTGRLERRTELEMGSRSTCRKNLWPRRNPDDADTQELRSESRDLHSYRKEASDGGGEKREMHH